MISVLWSNERGHQVISEKLLSENFTVWLPTASKYWKLCSLKIKIILQLSDEISVLLIAALDFKWILYGIEFLYSIIT